MSDARGRRERLYYPEGGHTSTDLDILSEPAARALAIARLEAEAEDRWREADQSQAERAAAAAAARDWQQYAHYVATVGRSFNKPDRWPKIEAIQRAVCRYYGISRAELLSQRRNQRVVRPRQVAVYLAKVLTLKSWPEIGRYFGGRDHSTAVHAHNRIAILAATDAQLAADVAAIRKTLEGI